jgi:hypothetical protein
MTSASPSISQDASSLRAAALLTLKSKAKPRYHLPPRADRPSPDDASSVASTRRATPSPELDYGSDDGIADAEGSTEEDEVEGEKEEGEISDDDTGAAAKTSPTLMDIDGGPLPGLASSSVGVKPPEDTSGQHRNHASPPMTFTPTAPKAVTHSTSVNSNSSVPKVSIVMSGQPSTASGTLPTAVKPISPTAPPLELGSHSSELSRITKLPTPSHTTTGTPPASILSDVTSRHIASRPSQRDVNRHETDAAANFDRSKDSRRASPPVSSQEANTTTSLSIQPPLDSAHVRPSLNSELSVWFHYSNLLIHSIIL